MLRTFLIAVAFGTGPALAQTALDMEGLGGDPTAPVEVTADSLSVDQTTNAAVFTGNVRIAQADLVITADEVAVTYDAASGDITRLDASGGVSFVSPDQAAQAAAAIYEIDSGLLTMTGGVTLAQGPTDISAERMVIDIEAETAELTGRVTTVLRQGDR